MATTTASLARALALLLGTPLRAALASLGEVGGALLDLDRLSGLASSLSAARARVDFDARAGLGLVTGTALFDAEGKPLPEADAQALLSNPLPDAAGAGMPLGQLLSSAVLRILDLRHPDWQEEEEGSTGHAEIRWRCRGSGGRVETRIGGIVGRRFVAVAEERFWGEDGVCCPQVPEAPLDNAG